MGGEGCELEPICHYQVGASGASVGVQNVKVGVCGSSSSGGNCCCYCNSSSMFGERVYSNNSDSSIIGVVPYIKASGAGGLRDDSGAQPGIEAFLFCVLLCLFVCSSVLHV